QRQLPCDHPLVLNVPGVVDKVSAIIVRSVVFKDGVRYTVAISRNQARWVVRHGESDAPDSAASELITKFQIVLSHAVAQTRVELAFILRPIAVHRYSYGSDKSHKVKPGYISRLNIFLWTVGRWTFLEARPNIEDHSRSQYRCPLQLMNVGGL